MFTQELGKNRIEKIIEFESDIMAVPKDLLKILACPKCKGDVKEENMFITCAKCQLAYPVLDSTIPDMLVEDAWPLSKAKKAAFKHKIRI